MAGRSRLARLGLDKLIHEKSRLMIRITSYNVCYTKLLRNEEATMAGTLATMFMERVKARPELVMQYSKDGDGRFRPTTYAELLEP